MVVHIVTCKHADSFNQGAIDALIASLTELLDLSREDRDLKGAYSSKLLTCRNRLLVAYRRLAPRLAGFAVKVSYASRGIRDSVGLEVQARAHQVIALVRSHFLGADATFDFIGASDLVELYRRRPVFSLDLTYQTSLNNSGSNYILLVGLEDYYAFCRDNEGKLRRYLFDSNVRDFMGLNRVNEDIAATLDVAGDADFWWLNNGVTILATNAWSTGNTLHMENVQIVNGLQTTETIFRNFARRDQLMVTASLSADQRDKRAVMVKVISSADEVTRDEIIRATNNQTSVEQISLHATDKIQRDVEDALIRCGLHYERRKNFYVNQGVATSSILTPMYLAAGALALGRRREPWSAVALKQRHLRSGRLYDELFGEKTNLALCAPIAKVMKAVDSVLLAERPAKASEGFLKKNRYLVALLAVARRLGTFNYADKDFVAIDCNADFAQVISSSLTAIPSAEKRMGRSKGQDVAICERFAQMFDLDGVARIREAGNALKEREPMPRSRKEASAVVSDGFIEQVFAVLPPQPWKPGTHHLVCRRLACSEVDYFAAVARLIAAGRVLRQRDGVIYTADGSVAGYDPARVAPAEDGSLRLVVTEPGRPVNTEPGCATGG
nr:AIPR family protein [Frateuria flava]